MNAFVNSAIRLNAPSGAQCFPTQGAEATHVLLFDVVSMHLLVLSAFRRDCPACTKCAGCVSMHLLVLSAFRPKIGIWCGERSFVSMHLLVLSAFRHVEGESHVDVRHVSMHLLVLSAFRRDDEVLADLGSTVSMHLLVLSAFRRQLRTVLQSASKSQVSMHLLVLSAFRRWGDPADDLQVDRVSMHLLVLSAFRPDGASPTSSPQARLNAPSGAQCFPTNTAQQTRQGHCHCGLNAPSGAQCFPTLNGHSLSTFRLRVSMHLLVLSAFRRLRESMWIVPHSTGLNAPSGAQCFPTYSIRA